MKKINEKQINRTQIKIELAIFGEGLVPTAITELSNITPTNMWMKGDDISHRKNLKRKENSWRFSTGFIQTLFVEDVTKIIVEKFAPIIEKISKHIRNHQLATKLYVVVEIYNKETPALYFGRELLEMLAKINSDIDIDLYT
jgi:hypothetical protein